MCTISRDGATPVFRVAAVSPQLITSRDTVPQSDLTKAIDVTKAPAVSRGGGLRSAARCYATAPGS